MARQVRKDHQMDGVFAISGKRLFDPLREKTTEDVLIIVEDGRILEVGKRDITHMPKNATRVDLSDCTVIPGLIDSHVHLSMGGEKDFILLEVRELNSYRALKAFAYAGRDLRAGFTTLRTAGEKGYADIALRRAADEGFVSAPLIIRSGKVLCVTGGHRDGYFAPDVSYEGSAVVVNGVDEVLERVREQSKMGVDWVKLIVTGGFDTPTDPDTQHMSDEEIVAAVKEARRLGKRTMAHAHGAESIKKLARAGIDSVEHGTFLDVEGAELMVKNNVYLSPTLWSSYSFMKQESQDDKRVTKAMEKYASHAEAFRIALDAGVKIVASSDAGGPRCYHGENVRELEMMVKTGMTECQALRSASIVAAEMLGMEDEIGTIQKGKLADIIATKGDPLENLGDLRNIEFVMKSGQIVLGDNRCEN